MARELTGPIVPDTGTVQRAKPLGDFTLYRPNKPALYRAPALNAPPPRSTTNEYDVTGLAAFAGYILGYWEVDRRDLMNVFHEGAIIFVLMVICIISSLIVYDWLFFLVRKHLLGKDVYGAEASQVNGRTQAVNKFGRYGSTRWYAYAFAKSA